MCELMVSELGPLLWKCAGDAVHFYLYFNICLKIETLSTSSTSGMMADVAFTEITNTVCFCRKKSYFCLC